MNINYITQEQNPKAINQNLLAKGFLDDPPYTGCTYVMLPTAEYQKIFQDLQKLIMDSGLPFSCVRIPHATVIAAKVIDKKPSEEWEELEAVQKIYQSYFLYHVKEKLDQGLAYREGVNEALLKAEKTLGLIASTNNRIRALNVIEDLQTRKAIIQTPDSTYDTIKYTALNSINRTNFTSKITQIKLNANGILTLQHAEDPRLLQLRLDLILAGEGISKWPMISPMKNAWSTIGYTETTLGEETKSQLDALIKGWMETHQKELQSVYVKFNTKHLGSLAFRSNDFFAVKNATFPLSQNWEKNINPTLTLEDLSLDKVTNVGGITPILGRRRHNRFSQKRWKRPLNSEVTIHGLVTN